MKRFLLFIFTATSIFASIETLQAQTAPVKQWDKTIGGDSGSDQLYAIRQTPDGGYILAGHSASAPGIGSDKSQVSRGYEDYWVVKLNRNGIKQWDKTYGGNESEFLTCLDLTQDGGYIIGGYTNSGIGGDKSQASRGYSDYWVVKLDSLGNKEWDKTLGGNNKEYLRSVKQTSDGGYILGGSSESGISGEKSQAARQFTMDYWIVKLDALGNKVWDKTIGGNGVEVLNSLQQTSDNGFILGGLSSSNANGDKSQPSKGFQDFWIVKLDVNGNKTWDKTLGGNDYDEVWAIQQTFDGGYIAGGTSMSNVSGDKSQSCRVANDFWVVKIDANGIKIWDKTFGGNSYDALYSLQQTSDGGYILAGTSESGASYEKSEPKKGSSDYWIVKINPNGIKVWDKTYGGTYIDDLYSIQQTSDGGFILGGKSSSGANGDKTDPAKSNYNSDYWVVKLGPNCTDLSATLFVDCSSSTNVSLNIPGLYSTTNSTPSWTITYTKDGVSQTATGSTPTFALAQNAAVGTVFSLVSITAGTCTTNLSNSLTILPPLPQPTINLISLDTLVSSVTGSSYLWKMNGTTLPTTSRKLKATVSGNYSVQVKNANNCTSLFSPDYSFIISGLKEMNNAEIRVYPNPTKGLVNLEFAEPINARVKIYNALGQCILVKAVSKQEKEVNLDLANAAKGIYTIQVIAEKQSLVKKIVLE